MNWKKLFIIVSCLILAFGFAGCSDEKNPTNPLGVGYPATLHAILCIADNDPTIGTSVAQDMLSINAWLDAISQNAGLPLNSIILKGTDNTLHSSTLTATISGLTVGANDVIIFYYSGHGGNLGTGSDWPVMLFSQTDYPDFYAISDQLKSKGARLLITLADCCNNYESQAKRISPFLTRRGTSSHYQTLFFQHKGSIIISAASPGEFSFGGSEGGMFTLEFLETFYENVASDTPSWQTIVDTATQPLGFISVETWSLHIFHPQPEIHVDNL